MGLSKIKTVQPNGTYQSKFDNSTMYVFDISLEDDSSGEVSAKKPDRWQVGDEVEYVMTQGQYGNKLKLTKPNADFTGGGGASYSNATRQDIISSQWAIGRALELEIAANNPNDISYRNIVLTAQMFKKWALDLDGIDHKNFE
tara:strand:- start:375 stop:803 length:429 start_codon:yes stop_codon:yes gene_type:complete